MSNETKQTAVQLLFAEFRALSKTSRFAGDDATANLIDFICEYEQEAKEMEKKQIMQAHYAPKYGCFTEDYYELTYGGNK
jgi:hypothetical protein